MKLNNALLIQPLSAAKMATVLKPDRVLSAYFGDLARQIDVPNNDVVLTFTTGLYQNKDASDPRHQRLSLLQREGEWRNRFDKLLHQQTGKTINGVPVLKDGFQYATWDQNITGAWNIYAEHQQKLNRAYAANTAFKQMIDHEITAMGREIVPANISFILEEIAVTAIWLRGYVPAEKSLRENDKPDAIHIVYPSEMPVFIAEGLQFLFGGKKDAMPLIWVNTENDERVSSSIYQFGKHHMTRYVS